MSINLRDAMKIGKFSECELITGKDNLSREIKNITIIENPEIIKWIGEKELLITSLYSIKDDSSAQKTLIRDLVNKGATALAIKCGSHLKEIPEVVLNSARQHNFPIISIPNEIKYLELIKPLMNLLFNNKITLQEDVNLATEKLDKMLIEDNDIEHVIFELEKILKQEIFFECDFYFNDKNEFKNDLNPLSKSQMKLLNINKTVMKLTRTINGTKNVCLVTPIFMNGVIVGNLTTFQLSDPLDSFQKAILEKAAYILSIKLLKIKLHQDVNQQYENDFVRNLIYSEEVLTAKNLKWRNLIITPETKFLAINIESPNLSAQKEYDFRRLAKEELSNVLISYSEKSILLILLSGPKQNDEYIYDTRQVIIDSIEKDFREFKVGIGNLEYSLEGLRRSYQQADKAVSLANDNEVVHYNRLGPFLIVDYVSDDPNIIGYYENILSSLKDKNKDFINTLVTYFKNNESLVDTSHSLFIHVNTLKYRLKRIEKVTNLNLQNTEDKYDLYLASILYRLRKKL